MVGFETPYVVLPGKNCFCCIERAGADLVPCEFAFDHESSTTFEYISEQGQDVEIFIGKGLAFGFWGNDTVTLGDSDMRIDEF